MAHRLNDTAIEMNGRGPEDTDGARSDYSYNTHNSQAPLSHGFPPTRGLANSDNGPRPSASYNVNFGGGSVRSASQPSPATQQSGFNEKPSYSSFSRPTSPVNRHQHGRPSYGQLPGASQSDANLMFAEGDMGKNAVSTWWLKALRSSIIVRWLLFILPIEALLWIPGILGLTAFPDATVWNVKLLYWSIYLTVLWVGWWACIAAAMVLPSLIRVTLGNVAPELRFYIDLLKAVHRYCAIVGWTVANWILFNQLINKQAGTTEQAGNDGPHITSIIVRAWFGIFLCSIVLLVEKACIQLIAHSFHQVSYEDRIAEQKVAINALVILYANSQELGRHDLSGSGRNSPNPGKVLKSALKGFRNVAQTATTGLGIIASEIANERVLQPNSPESRVTQALSSPNKSRQLARRIFYSFARDPDVMRLEDIQIYFSTIGHAKEAFESFDKDGNGDATLEEMEMALMELHRERLALASSMRDVDSAVGRLDKILMGIFWLVAIFIMLGLLVTAFNTLLTAAGTFILGLSWLIGTTAQEILLSIIFLFIKHPYDVGDRVDFDDQHYTVKEMHLLSSTFRKIDGTFVQVPHTLLNAKVICNIRRSGPIMEFYKLDVAFDTTFEQIEKLRESMLEFIEANRRDFNPSFDITVEDLPEQGRLSLEVPIMYRSNWQNVSLKWQRRNKWVCALKLALAAHSIFGPDGAGNPVSEDPGPTLIKMVPSDPAPSYEAENQNTRRASSIREERQEEADEARFDISAAVRRHASVLSNSRAAMHSLESDVFDGPAGRSVAGAPMTYNNVDTRNMYTERDPPRQQ